MNPQPRRVVTRNGVKPPGGYRVVDRNGTRALVRWDRLTPMEQSRFGGRPAPRPAPRPTPRPARDPLDSVVDSIISSSVAPIREEQRQMQEQSAGDVLQQKRLGETYDHRVAGVQDGAKLDLGAAVAEAAKLRGYSDDTIRQYQDWSRGLMAPTHGGTGDALVAESERQVRDATGSAFDSMGRELAARGENLGGWLARQRDAGAAQTRELVNQELLRRASANRGFEAQVGAERAKRGALKYDALQKEREYAFQKLSADRSYEMQKAALGMDKYKTDLAAGQFYDDLGYKQSKDAADNKGIYGLGKDRDEAIRQVMTAWGAGLQNQTDEDGNVILGDNGKPVGPTIKNPWRELFDLLGSQAGLTSDQAALLATKTSPNSIRNAKHGVPGVIRMLRSRKVSEAVQRFIVRSNFGPSAVSKYFGGRYGYGGNTLAPGMVRTPPTRSGPRPLIEPINQPTSPSSIPLPWKVG